MQVMPVPAPEFFGAIGDLVLGEGDEIGEQESFEVVDELEFLEVELPLGEIDDVDEFQRFLTDSSGLFNDVLGLGRLGADLVGLEVAEEVVEVVTGRNVSESMSVSISWMPSLMIRSSCSWAMPRS